MYKCAECGNTEKFEGFASESGSAEIIRHGKGYDWLYRVSEKNWESNITIKACFFCRSKKIIKV